PGVGANVDMGVEGGEPRRRPLRLEGADIPGGEQHLALQVAVLHPVAIDDAEHPDAGGGQVQTEGGAEATGADQQHPGTFEARLPRRAEVRQRQVAAVAGELFWGELFWRELFWRERCR